MKIQMKEITTKTIEIGYSATDKLNVFLSENYKNILVVCDTNTVKFHDNITAEHVYYTYPSDVHATPEAAAEISDSFIECDVMIACGAGTIHDITRYAAHERNIPFIAYPTAASVDGFVSNVAAMTIDHRKKTLISTPPIALFADPNVFTTAPNKLTVSGVCDIIGKYISLFEWKFSALITDEQLDHEIIKMTEEAVNKLMNLDVNDENYTITVMEGLTLSGMVIQMYGNSRPASGAEHHLSHLWEMHCINGETPALHGEKVGVATLILLEKYKNLKEIKYRQKSITRGYLAPVYGDLTDGIIDENTPSSLDSISQANIDKNIDAIFELIRELPDLDKLTAYYNKIGALTTLAELELPDSDEFLAKTLEFAPYVRNRLTLLKIL